MKKTDPEPTNHAPTDPLTSARTSAQPATSAIPENKNQKPDQDELSKQRETPKEHGGPAGLEPTRYGDWERKGRCTDF